MCYIELKKIFFSEVEKNVCSLILMKYRVGYFKFIFCKIMYLPVKLDCIIWSCGYDPDVEQAMVYFPSGSLFHIYPVSLIQYD